MEKWRFTIDGKLSDKLNGSIKYSSPNRPAVVFSLVVNGFEQSTPGFSLMAPVDSKHTITWLIDKKCVNTSKIFALGLSIDKQKIC